MWNVLDTALGATDGWFSSFHIQKSIPPSQSLRCGIQKPPFTCCGVALQILAPRFRADLQYLHHLQEILYICTHRQHIERGRKWIYTRWNCQGFPVVPTGHSIFCSYGLCGFSFIHISKKLHKTTTQAGYQITAGTSTLSYLILSRYFSKPTITSTKEISKKESIATKELENLKWRLWRPEVGMSRQEHVNIWINKLFYTSNSRQALSDSRNGSNLGKWWRAVPPKICGALSKSS